METGEGGSADGGRPQRAKRRCVKQVAYNDGSDFLVCDSDGKKFAKLLDGKSFVPYRVRRIAGSQLTAAWAREDGLREPVLATCLDGLGVKVPANTFSVRDVARVIGGRHPLSVIEVATQAEVTGWCMADWADYYENRGPDVPPLNVISLEFSDTPLRQLVNSPQMVRDLDWIDACWPAEKKHSGDYPQVQYYCLMSAGGSYTDFHIDFGGSSVWYHVLRGQKVFLFAEPTPQNLRVYEEWICSPTQESTFFGDVVEECYRVEVQAGETMIIPTGWIHAVFTPEDSLVFGGNFLHSLNIPLQIDVHAMEVRTHILPKFRFPYFLTMMWYAASWFLEGLRREQAAEDRSSATAEASSSGNASGTSDAASTGAGSGDGGASSSCGSSSFGGGGGSGGGGGRRLCGWEREGLPKLVEACEEWLKEKNEDHEGGDGLPKEWCEAAAAVGCETPAAMIAELQERVGRLSPAGAGGFKRRLPASAAAGAAAAMKEAAAAKETAAAAKETAAAVAATAGSRAQEAEAVAAAAAAPSGPGGTGGGPSGAAAGAATAGGAPALPSVYSADYKIPKIAKIKVNLSQMSASLVPTPPALAPPAAMSGWGTLVSPRHGGRNSGVSPGGSNVPADFRASSSSEGWGSLVSPGGILGGNGGGDGSSGGDRSSGCGGSNSVVGGSSSGSSGGGGSSGSGSSGSSSSGGQPPLADYRITRLKVKAPSMPDVGGTGAGAAAAAAVGPGPRGAVAIPIIRVKGPSRPVDGVPSAAMATSGDHDDGGGGGSKRLLIRLPSGSGSGGGRTMSSLGLPDSSDSEGEHTSGGAAAAGDGGSSNGGGRGGAGNDAAAGRPRAKTPSRGGSVAGRSPATRGRRPKSPGGGGGPPTAAKRTTVVASARRRGSSGGEGGGSSSAAIDDDTPSASEGGGQRGQRRLKKLHTLQDYVAEADDDQDEWRPDGEAATAASGVGAHDGDDDDDEFDRDFFDVEEADLEPEEAPAKRRLISFRRSPSKKRQLPPAPPGAAFGAFTPGYSAPDAGSGSGGGGGSGGSGGSGSVRMPAAPVMTTQALRKLGTFARPPPSRLPTPEAAGAAAGAGAKKKLTGKAALLKKMKL